MKRMLATVALLVGASSCTPVRDNPFTGVRNQPITTRAAPPSPTTWKAPTGVPVVSEFPADPAADPNLARAQAGLPAGAHAGVQGWYGSRSTSLSPYGANPPYAGITVQPAPSRPNAVPGNGPTGMSSASAGLETPLGTSVETLIGTPDPALPLSGTALPMPVVVTGNPSAEAQASLADVTGVGAHAGARGQTLVPDQQPDKVSLASFVEGATQQPLIENRNPTPAVPPQESRVEGQELRARGGRLSAPDPPLSTPEVVDLEPPSPPTPLGPSVPILRMVNSKRITLNFELKDSASSGTPAIDLWVTRDMRTWKKHEVQRPATGSYLIQVNDEGLYGFTLIARGSQGPQPIPHSGDLPQVWVTVDATPPVVQLAGVELSLTSREPALVVRWKAQDRNFNRKPITVSYAEQAEGPWVPLATGIDNTGRLELPVPANLPKRLYLRVEAQDVAGNVGRAQTPAPIQLPWAGSLPTVPGTETPRLPPPPNPEARPQVSIISVDGTEGK